jgi:hypothetical protein
VNDITGGTLGSSADFNLKVKLAWTLPSAFSFLYKPKSTLQKV